MVLHEYHTSHKISYPEVLQNNFGNIRLRVKFFTYTTVARQWSKTYSILNIQLCTKLDAFSAVFRSWGCVTPCIFFVVVIFVNTDGYSLIHPQLKKNILHKYSVFDIRHGSVLCGPTSWYATPWVRILTIKREMEIICRGDLVCFKVSFYFPPYSSSFHTLKNCYKMPTNSLINWNLAHIKGSLKSINGTW